MCQLDRYAPILQVISEERLLDNVTVTVEWTQQIGALYNVRVMPLVPIVFIGNVSSQLTLSYNIEYNLSVVAVTPCGNATSFIRLNYGKVYLVTYNTLCRISCIGAHNIILFCIIIIVYS